MAARAPENPPLILEQGQLDAATPAQMDALWAAGWRHFGPLFFRYSLSITEGGEMQRVQPLRLDLAAFHLSKTHRRLLRRHTDLPVRIAPATVDAEREELFQRHKTRFTSNVPETLRDFIASAEPARRPCECREIQIWKSDRLIAVSYLDLGATTASSVYAIFDPAFAACSPGILTLLHEIEFARATGRRFLYLGYAMVEPSHYDYKKRFTGVQAFDWEKTWSPLPDVQRSIGA